MEEMSEDLDTVLATGSERDPTAQSSRPVTLLARLCQVFGSLTLVLGVVCFIPDREGVDFGPLGSASLFVLIACFGQAVFVPLTAIAATIAALRIRFSKRQFRGWRQIWLGIGFGASGYALTCVWEWLQ